MRLAVVILALLPAWASTASAAEGESVSVKQIISTCIQKGSAPCAVGVDKRTIIIENKSYNVSDDVVKQLEGYFRENQQKLSGEEKKRYEALHNDLQRVESKIEEVGEDVKKLRRQAEENSRLLKGVSGERTEVVPNVVGMDVEQAKETLHRRNIVPKTTTNPVKIADLVAPGTVLAQTPSAGTEIDPRATTVELALADEPHDPDGQYRLALKYENGDGIAADYGKAAYWYTKAADSGHMSAQFNLGHLYLAGKGVRNDPNMVFKYWRLAANKGLPEAQHSLGLLYVRGYGEVQDRKEGIDWLNKAAAKGLSNSRSVLGLIRLEDAAEAGSAEAQFRLAELYFTGNGVPQNLHKAVQLYRSSAERGYANAQYNMGVFSEEGRGVPRSLIKAFEWYKKAAEQGHANAQNSLGTMYMQGRAVPQDYVLGIVWFNVSASQGLDDAKTNLNQSKQLYLSRSDIARINELSRAYYERYVAKKKTGVGATTTQ